MRMLFNIAHLVSEIHLTRFWHENNLGLKLISIGEFVLQQNSSKSRKQWPLYRIETEITAANQSQEQRRVSNIQNKERIVYS